MSEKLKAEGPSILRVAFDPETNAALRENDVQHILYHLRRLLQGEASAVMEWEHYGMRVDLRPWSGE